MLRVTPYTGVWVEIAERNADSACSLVTPYTGVWVEICKLWTPGRSFSSRPTRACELKFKVNDIQLNSSTSRPTRACELKWCNAIVFLTIFTGHALHGRVSWNYCQRNHRHHSEVTPYTGVWVEIAVTFKLSLHGMSRPTRACELKFWNFSFIIQVENVTPYTGVWVEICWTFWMFVAMLIVTPYTGVWVEIARRSYQDGKKIVTPYTGVWVEITHLVNQLSHKLVTPYTGVWVEISLNVVFILKYFVTPYTGVWVEITACRTVDNFPQSRPTRACELKSWYVSTS